MSETFHFSLVSPERELFSGAVEHVVVPGAEGDFGVLPRHAPFMATLRPGALVVFQEGVATRLFVQGGFADVTPDGLTVLADDAAPLAEMDAGDVAAQLEEARGLVASADESERPAAEAALARLEALSAALNDRSYTS